MDLAGEERSGTSRPFSISIPERDLGDLRVRLERTRWSPEPFNESWSCGVDGSYLRDLADYWAHDYDWRTAEAELNSFPQYVAAIAGCPIHYLHIRGVGRNCLPIVLTHGWPWTFADWLALVGPLTDPAAYGGDPNDAFDVVIPSLPGYVFSTPLTRPGIDQAKIADLWFELMYRELGYERFAAAGGDWGAAVSIELGLRHGEHVAGVYLSMPPVRLAGGIDQLRPDQYGPDEEGWYERTKERWQATISHVTVHSRDPQTLAWGLNDSPVGLLAWLLERRRSESDCGGDVEASFTRDFLLTSASLYWFTNSIASSFQLYRETFAGSANPSSAGRLEVPTGIGVFPAEVARLPRRLCERVVNLTHWSVLTRGGHFAPAEVPALYVEELRSMFRNLR